MTLQLVPTDLLICVEKFMRNDTDVIANDIHEVTLAAMLDDYVMLEHYLQKYDKSTFNNYITHSGNRKAMNWAKDNSGFHFNKRKWSFAVQSGNLAILELLRCEG